jgi:hypothetical protein
MDELTDQVKTTYETWKDGTYKSYLKTFGILKVPKIETEEVSMYEHLSEQFREIRAAIDDMRSDPKVHELHNPKAHDLATGLLTSLLTEEPILAMLDAEQRNHLCAIALAFVTQYCVGRDYSLGKAAFHVEQKFLQKCPSASGLHPDTRKGLVRAAVKWCYDTLGLGGSG